VCVGVLVLDCIVTESQSLKTKRHVLASLTDRVRRSFNSAVCEVDHQDQWQRSRLAVVLVNTEWRMLQSTMSKVVQFIERDRRLQILDVETRRLS
jgi:uncharacterized protein YlxP (DUF503 family)